MNDFPLSENQRWMLRDLKVLWHPCTQMKDHEQLPLVPIRSGEGVWLFDFDGNRYLDAVSSWWVNLFGHCNPVINQAIKNQVDKLEHVLIAGFSHEPVIALSEQLVQITPPGLTRCFYADNGSSAVEVALKMSFHAWRNQGRVNKKKFVCLSNSYHGETLATLSVGDVALYKETYEPLLMESLIVPGPDCYHREPGQSWEDYSKAQFVHMCRTIEQHADEISAVIVEPLVQCAGNMRMYHPVYLKLLRELCDKFDVHLIADEIAVGFGRTGKLFACEHADISPDFLCLSKGLTGGYLPLSVVLTTDTVYQSFYDDYVTLKAFLHSHSYTGNPLGCAAALATLELLNQEQLSHNQKLAQVMSDAGQEIAQHPNVYEVRQYGMILAIEMVRDKASKTPYPWQERRGLRVYQQGLKQSMLLRPLGNVVYWMPPYVITESEINWLARVTLDCIHEATV